MEMLVNKIYCFELVSLQSEKRYKKYCKCIIILYYMYNSIVIIHVVHEPMPHPPSNIMIFCIIEMVIFLKTSNNDNYTCAVTITCVSLDVFMCAFCRWKIKELKKEWRRETFEYISPL